MPQIFLAFVLLLSVVLCRLIVVVHRLLNEGGIAVPCPIASVVLGLYQVVVLLSGQVAASILLAFTFLLYLVLLCGIIVVVSQL